MHTNSSFLNIPPLLKAWYRFTKQISGKFFTEENFGISSLNIVFFTNAGDLFHGVQYLFLNSTDESFKKIFSPLKVS